VPEKTGCLLRTTGDICRSIMTGVPLSSFSPLEVDGFELVGQEEIRSQRRAKQTLCVDSITRMPICNGHHFVGRRIEARCPCCC
jgi:hypothetical protein